MSRPSFTFRKTTGFVLGLLFFVGAASAQRRDRGRYYDFGRFSISVGGGIDFNENHTAASDLQAELQFAVRPRIRLGFSVGYLASWSGRDGDRDRRRYELQNQDGLAAMGFWQWVAQNGRSGQELGHTYRIIPLNLNLYYSLPVGRRWDVYASAGGGFYLGSFAGTSETVHKNAWGGRAGLGVEFRLARNVILVAAGDYRFVEFRDLKENRPDGPWILVQEYWRRLAPAALMKPGLVELMNRWLDWLRPKPVGVDLNGVSLRAGVKFGI